MWQWKGVDVYRRSKSSGDKKLIGRLQIPGAVPDEELVFEDAVIPADFRGLNVQPTYVEEDQMGRFKKVVQNHGNKDTGELFGRPLAARLLDGGDLFMEQLSSRADGNPGLLLACRYRAPEHVRQAQQAAQQQQAQQAEQEARRMAAERQQQARDAQAAVSQLGV